MTVLETRFRIRPIQPRSIDHQQEVEWHAQLN